MAANDGDLRPYTRITLRPIGSPLPLGLLALMCAGVVLSLQQVGALTTSDSLNTYDVLRPDKLLFTKSAFEKVEARLSQE